MPESTETDRSTVRLLVVDDDENNRDMLSRRLMRRGYTVEVAPDGFAALAMLRGPAFGRFDLVLLDIEMPGKSGFDVLAEVRRTTPATTLPVIIATARHGREDVVHALGLGANDYVTKPIDFPVVLARVEAQLAHKRAVDRIVALEADVRRRNTELAKANDRMRQSLTMAAKVQHALLPAANPLKVGGLDFAWRFSPCDELGGDIFNAFALPGDTVGIYLLDVSGHGVPAALLSVTLSRLLTPMGAASLVEQVGPDGTLVARAPAAVVGELNRRFPIHPESNQYFTIFYAVFDCRHGKLTYVTAGHPPAVHVRGEVARPLDGDGFAVGWFDDASFDEQHVDLAPGDRVVIYSDGIPETMDPEAVHFGHDRLTAALGGRHAEAIGVQLDGLMRDVDAFRAGADVCDDVTVLVMQCTCPQE